MPPRANAQAAANAEDAAAARRERHSNATIACTHPGNVEYALYFYKMMERAELRALDDPNRSAQWPMSLGKVVRSLTQAPHRVRSLEHAHALHGVGEKTLKLFKEYMEEYPPDAPTPEELEGEAARADIERRARELEKQRKKQERDAAKAARKAREEAAAMRARAAAGDAAATADAATGTAPARANAKRKSYDPHGDDDDVVMLDDDDDDEAPRGTGTPRRASGAAAAAAASPGTRRPPPPKRARANNAGPKKPWEPGYKTAAFAIAVTLHKLRLQGETDVLISRLKDEAEASGLSAKGIHPAGGAGANNIPGGGNPYRGGGGRGGGRGGYTPQYCGWSCFEGSFIKARSISHRFPYDRVGVVNADPRGFF